VQLQRGREERKGLCGCVGGEVREDSVACLAIKLG
jgi:hypothetical protein